MRIERYRPAFVTGFEDEYAEVQTFDELMDVEWIKSWSENKDFYRYSICIDKTYNKNKQRTPSHNLMCELKNGAEWWVVAIIREENIDFITDNLFEFSVNH